MRLQSQERYYGILDVSHLPALPACPACLPTGRVKEVPTYRASEETCSAADGRCGGPLQQTGQDRRDLPRESRRERACRVSNDEGRGETSSSR